MISFHSLEDRMVKQCIAAAARPAAAYARLPLRESEMPQPVLYSLGRVQAEDDEVAVNACACSAVLRAAERSATPLPAEGGAAFVHTGSCPAATSPFRARAEREGAADGPRQPDHCRVADAVGHFTGHQSVSVAPALRRAGQGSGAGARPEVGWRRLQLERAELARNARVDAIARDSLKMISIVPDRTLYLNQALATGGAQ